MIPEILMMQHSRLIMEAAIEIATAEREIACYGEWRTDHAAMTRTILEEAEQIESELSTLTDSREQEVQGETVATGTIVLATLQHWYTKNTRYAVLKKVDLDDEVYRIAYEDAQLSDDWNVVDVRVLTTKPGEG